MVKTVSILNMKGGVGKTTITLNLAYYLSEFERKKILVIDFDPQANSSSALLDFETYDKHRNERVMISEIFADIRRIISPISAQPHNDLEGKITLNKLTTRVVEHEGGGFIDLIPSELELSSILERATGQNVERRLNMILGNEKNRYDIILIDCSPTFSVLTNNSLIASDYVLVPVKPDPFSARGIPMLMEKIALHNEINPTEKVKPLGIVFNMVKDKSYIDSIKGEILRVNRDVFFSELKYTEYYPMALFKQTSIYKTRAQSEFKDNFTEFAKEFLEKL